MKVRVGDIVETEYAVSIENDAIWIPITSTETGGGKLEGEIYDAEVSDE